MRTRSVRSQRLRRIWLLAIGICSVCTICASAQETPISGVVESIGIFKNGVVVVSERFDVPSAGRYATFAPPAPLHGAFFVESDAMVDTTASSAETEIPLADVADVDWRRDFQGRWLRVVLPNEEEPRTVRVLPTPKSNSDSSLPVGVRALSSESLMSVSRGVLLECENGETVWLADVGALRSITLAKGDLPATVSRKKERLIFDVKPVENAKGATIRLVYLTRGATWAPQYRIDLKDDKTLEIEQTAILLNEWRDLADVPVELYSGFPQIEYLNSSSPMNPSVSLDAFFASLGSSSGDRRRLNTNMAMTQAVIMSNNNNMMGSMGGGMTDSALSSDDEAVFNEGVDLYAQSIGKKTLAKGDRAAFQIAKASAPYKRVVCWDIFDARADNLNNNQSGDAYGRTTSSSTSAGRTFKEPWDVLLFDNPFKFPLTTGPYSVLSSGRFLGQNTLYWSNSQEKVLAPVTKALSVRATSTEEERQFNEASTLPFRETEFNQNLFFEQKLLPQEYQGRVFNIQGIRYRVLVIDATIELYNQRSDETTVRLSRRYGGVAIPESFEGFEVAPTPKRNTSADTSYINRVTNPQEELRWTTTLQPGEKKTLKFSYQKIVR